MTFSVVFLTSTLVRKTHTARTMHFLISRLFRDFGGHADGSFLSDIVKLVYISIRL